MGRQTVILALAVVTALVVGLLVGGLVGVSIQRVQSEARDASATDSGGNLAERSDWTTRELADVAMRRVGRTFVEDSWMGKPTGQPLIFYAPPKPYGGVLCRVDVFTVAEKTTRGRTIRLQENWDDDLTIERMYGFWRMPTGPASAEDARDGACARFRDFGSLIAGDPGAVERGVGSLLIAAAAARAGNLTTPLSCNETSAEGDRRPCDALAVLRSFSVTNIQGGDAITSNLDGPNTFVDDITLDAVGAGCGTRRVTRFRVKSPQTVGPTYLTVAQPITIDVFVAETC